jgi:hypothetical protein
MSRTSVALENDLWIKFLASVIAGLREAAHRIGGEELKPHYEARSGWFGRARKDQGGSRIPQEEAISQALVEVLTRMRSDQLVEGRFPESIDLTRMEFHVETPRRIEEGIGSQALPTDIMIGVIQDEIDLRIEAKNVIRVSEIAREYLGPRGLGRFDDSRSPYTMERFGGMLAYVMDEDAATWQARIHQAIHGAQPPLTILSTTVAGESLVTTSHDREVDNPLHGIRQRCRTDVIHLVLEFEADPSLRGR